MTTCPECNDTGERDSGGTHPWGEPVYLPCDCKDAEIGKRWREDSSLEKWFPLTAERLEKLEAENATLKRDLQYARDGLTKGRSRMREDNERLAREAHIWSKAAETYAAELERHKPLMQEVEWILEDGHMNQEHLARLRAAWAAVSEARRSEHGSEVGRDAADADAA